MNVQQISEGYQLIDQISPKHSSCFSMAIRDKELFVSWFDSIKIFDFELGKLTEKYVLNDKKIGIISALLPLKSNNVIFSGCTEGNILEWGSKNEIGCHSNLVLHLITNKKEDQIISCSGDFSIKFWRFEEKWKCLQTLILHNAWVYQICLNQSETQLVSCSKDSRIIICEKRNERWFKKQTIQVEIYGFRVGFITDDLIVFQSNNHDMLVFKQEKQIFSLKEKLSFINRDGVCYLGFHLIYNEKKNIIVSKNGQDVNIIKFTNNRFILLQSIQFQSNNIQEQMTEDGQYLIIWDSENRQFQIRKYFMK